MFFTHQAGRNETGGAPVKVVRRAHLRGTIIRGNSDVNVWRALLEYPSCPNLLRQRSQKLD